MVATIVQGGCDVHDGEAGQGAAVHHLLQALDNAWDVLLGDLCTSPLSVSSKVQGEPSLQGLCGLLLGRVQA